LELHFRGSHPLSQCRPYPRTAVPVNPSFPSPAVAYQTFERDLFRCKLLLFGWPIFRSSAVSGGQKIT
jgi:hypothetical protein